MADGKKTTVTWRDIDRKKLAASYGRGGSDSYLADELKVFCESLGLSQKGTKDILINNIIKHLDSGRTHWATNTIIETMGEQGTHHSKWREIQLNHMTEDRKSKIIKLDKLLPTQEKFDDLQVLCKCYYDICSLFSVTSLQAFFGLDIDNMCIILTPSHRTMNTSYDSSKIIVYDNLGIVTTVDRESMTKEQYQAIQRGDNVLGYNVFLATKIIKSLIGFDFDFGSYFPKDQLCLNQSAFERYMINEVIMLYDKIVVYGIFDCPGAIRLSTAEGRPYFDYNWRISGNNEKTFNRCKNFIIMFLKKSYPLIEESKLLEHHIGVLLSKRSIDEVKTLRTDGLRLAPNIIGVTADKINVISDLKQPSDIPSFIKMFQSNTIITAIDTKIQSQSVQPDIKQSQPVQSQTVKSNIERATTQVKSDTKREQQLQPDIKQDTKLGQNAVKCSCGHNNIVNAKFCCECGAPVQKLADEKLNNTIADEKIINSLLFKIEELTGVEDYRVIDFINLRLNTDDTVMKYLNLGTKRVVNKTTASIKTCVDHQQMICSDGISAKHKMIVNNFNLLVQYFDTISKYLKSTIKPDTRSPTQKLIDSIFNNQMFTIDTKRGSIPKDLRDFLFVVSEGKCYCCNTKIVESFFEAGHIVPHKYGGDINPDNLRAVCNKCNDDMGTMHMHEFMIDNKCEIEDEDTSYIEMAHNMQQVILDKLSVKPLKDGYQDKVLVILDNHKKYYLMHRVLLMNVLYNEL